MHISIAKSYKLSKNKRLKFEYQTSNVPNRTKLECNPKQLNLVLNQLDLSSQSACTQVPKSAFTSRPQVSQTSSTRNSSSQHEADRHFLTEEDAVENLETRFNRQRTVDQ